MKQLATCKGTLLNYNNLMLLGGSGQKEHCISNIYLSSRENDELDEGREREVTCG
jgi:hypothetical protein